MEQQKISGLQLFYLIAGFEFGTAMLFGIGAKSMQDAWLVIVIAMLSSLILMGVFTQLSLYYPNDTFVSMMPKIIGKYLSYPLITFYMIYFIYSASRGCRDFGDLISSSILVDTPTIVVIGSFMVLMIYCLRGGIETFGRMGEMVFPIYIMSMIIVWILLISTESFNLKNLTPLFGNGVKPILKEVYPKGINFPFGETFIIMMFFPFLNNKRSVRKIGMSVILFGGIVLTVNSIIVLAVLGPEIYGRQFFPLLQATRLVSIADFLERFDVMIILMMVVGVFFKVGSWIYGASITITHLFKLNHSKSVLLGLGSIITPLSLIIASDFVVHLEFGLGYNFFLFYHVPLQIIVPIILLCIAFIRKKFNSENSST